VLLHSAGLVHPSLRARRALADALGALPGVRLEPAGEIARFPALREPAHRAVVAYFHRRRIADATLDALEDFVARGGGLLAVHAASASFKRSERWRKLLGGRFVGHGPIHRFRVEPAESADPIFRGLPAFEVRDELYRHEWAPDVRIHFHTEIDGTKEPVVWTRQHGQGRVAYLSLGHVAGALRNETAAELLRRALTWVA
jgi:type 1 glutamine amidotransferase